MGTNGHRRLCGESVVDGMGSLKGHFMVFKLNYSPFSVCFVSLAAMPDSISALYVFSLFLLFCFPSPAAIRWPFLFLFCWLASVPYLLSLLSLSSLSTFLLALFLSLSQLFGLVSLNLQRPLHNLKPLPLLAPHTRTPYRCTQRTRRASQLHARH